MTQSEKDLEMVKRDGHTLAHVGTQTPEICLEAVRNNGMALRFVKAQTPEICMAAIKQNGWAIEYVKVQTPELCMVAVKKDGWSLQFVRTQTPEICIEAVKKNMYSLKYVDPKLICSDLYLLGLSSLKSRVMEINDYSRLISYIIGWDLNWQKILEEIEKIKKGIDIIEILKSDMGYLQFLDTETLGVEDYHEILDYIIEYDPELTEYQREQLNRLDKTL